MICYCLNINDSKEKNTITDKSLRCTDNLLISNIDIHQLHKHFEENIFWFWLVKRAISIY